MKLNTISTRTNLDTLKNADVLQNLKARIQPRKLSTPSRRWTSSHLFDPLSIPHQKGAASKKSFTISTGNLTSSDIYNMNNLSIKFNGKYGEDMANFAFKVMSPHANLSEAGYHVQTTEDITIIHDFNNLGDPGRLPLIHQIAERLINPKRNGEIIPSTSETEFTYKKPKEIVYLSPYVPDGIMARTLIQQAQNKEVKVIIPREPLGDYRENKFPFNIQAHMSSINRSREILRPYRERPSHIKCLIVKYEDGTAAVLFGSDNYLTSLQKFLRNEEIAVLIQINKNSNEEIKTFYRNLCQTLFQLGEINEETYLSLRLPLSARDGT